jgi:hypothetical protein
MARDRDDDDEERSQRTDYAKKGDKDRHEGKLEMISGGHKSEGNNGPTGSERHYPKGKRGADVHKTDWNPQKIRASTYAVDGVKCD